MKNNMLKKTQLFFLGYALMLVSQMFANVIYFENIIYYLDYVAIALLTIYIVISRKDYNKKDIIKLLLFSIVSVIIYLVSNDKKLLKLSILIIAFKNINFEAFIRFDFKYRFLFLIIVVTLNLFGLMECNNVFRDGTMRYSLGFQHPNNFAVYSMVLCLEYIYIYRNRKKWHQYLFLTIALACNVFLTDSRACIGIITLIIVYISIPSNILIAIYNNLIVKKLILHSFLIFFIISLAISLNYNTDNKLINAINDITSDRIKIADRYFGEYPALSIFGNDLSMSRREINGKLNPNYVPLDNAYIHILLEWGIIMAIIFALLYYVSLKRLYKSSNYILIFILIMWEIYSIMEATGMSVIYNPFLLVFALVFYNYVAGISTENKLDTTKDKEGKKMNELIIEIGNATLKEIEKYGFVLPGNNGPYNCCDTPVRNSSHWIGIYAYLYKITKNEKYYNVIEILANYLISQKSVSGAIECMTDDKFDRINGSIGQAWAIEGLIKAFEITNKTKYYDKAVQIFLSQRYNLKKHLWERIELDETNIGYDVIFNHQLWFAASGFLINKVKKNEKIFSIIDDFMKNIDLHYEIYSDGLFKHHIASLHIKNNQNWKSYIKSIFGFLSYFNPKFDKRSFEKGYHIFDMYGFAIIYNCNNTYKVFLSEKFKGAVNYAIDIDKINKESNINYFLKKKALLFSTNKYLYSYNSPAFEFPFIDYTFNNANKSNIYQELFDKQVKATYNGDKKKFSRNTNDGNTLTARLYELTRYLEMSTLNDKK